MIVNSGITNVILRTAKEAYKEMDPMVLYQMRSREALGDDAK
jgi:dCMP deaminase